MNYILSIDFNKDKDIIYIKDNAEHFAPTEIYSITTTPVEELKEAILPFVDAIIDFYKEKCSSQDEAN